MLFNGNVVDWSNSSWTFFNMRQIQIQSNHLGVCQFHEKVLVPGKWNFKSAKTICKALKGKMNLITNSENQQKVISLMEEHQCQYGD